MARMRRLLPVLLSAALLSPVLGWAKGAAPRGSVATQQVHVHTVYQGQTLGMIAKRYNVSVEALCSFNAITRRSPIKPGQKLLVPNKDSTDAPPAAERKAPPPTEPTAPNAKQNLLSAADTREARPAGKPDNRHVSWKKYARPARRAGYVSLKATGRNWQGYAVVKGNRLSTAGERGFRHALYSWRTGTEADIDPRLIRILVKVSDTFGGRPLRIVSGFREHSYSKESKHKKGRACDLSVEGVPNEVLRDYLMTFEQVGVGYYPNSSFVHLDVRAQSTTWVDRSSPGERPEYDHADDE